MVPESGRDCKDFRGGRDSPQGAPGGVAAVLCECRR